VTEKIGDTLFVNGVPHSECAHCGKPYKPYDEANRTVVAKRGEKFGALKPLMLTILYGWADSEVDTGWQVINGIPYPIRELRKRPIVRQQKGCFDCYTKQQSIKARDSRLAVWALKPYSKSQ
jgi:hypothetical protein